MDDLFDNNSNMLRWGADSYITSILFNLYVEGKKMFGQGIKQLGLSQYQSYWNILRAEMLRKNEGVIEDRDKLIKDMDDRLKEVRLLLYPPNIKNSRMLNYAISMNNQQFDDKIDSIEKDLMVLTQKSGIWWQDRTNNYYTGGQSIRNIFR